MANPKLFSEFRSSHGLFYKIEIWDDEYTGTDPDQFDVTRDGFQLTYSGQTDDIYSPIIGSSVSFGMYVQDSATNAFLTNLKEYQQDRYYIKIRKYKPEQTSDVADDFRQRVQNDGGTFESGDCVDDALTELGVGSETLTNTFVEYHKNRVESDGGIFEGENCAIDAINALGGTKDVPIELYDFHWGGYIVQDIIEVEDVSQPYVLNIQATDGISKLKDTLCGTSFFRQFTNQFINALDQAGVLDIYDSNDPVLAVVCDWWAEEMTYNANNNPLDEVFADFHAFDTIDEQGFYTNKNWFEILSQMCTIFGLRFYYSAGQYRLEQLFERAESSFTEHRYKKDKTKIDFQSGVYYNRTIDQTSDKARLAGNIFNFLPAVNDVAITLNQEPKAMKGVTWDNSNDPDLAIGLVSSALQNQLTLVFNHQIKLFLNVNVNQNNIFAKLKLNIELFDFNNNITYYLDRTYTGTTPSAPVWTTTQSGSGYEILVGTFQEFSGQVTLGNSDVIQVGGPTTIVTPPIPADGDMTINWDFVQWVNTNGSVRGLNIGNSSSYKMTLQSVDSSFGSIQNQTTVVRAVSPNADINGLVSYELPETNIFTGQGERGSLVNQYDVGGLLFKIPYSNWREGNSGSYVEIQKLVCQELLKLMDSPVQKYTGGMFSSHDFRQRLTFDGNNWIQLGGTYSANMDQWDGEWFVINRATITPTFDEVELPIDNVNFGNVNGLTGGVSFDGIDAVNLDTNILDVTTTASVGTNLDVGGDTDLTGRLDVAGPATMPSAQLTGGAGSQGTMQWNGDEDTISLVMNGTTHFIGQDVVYNVKNQTGELIDKGTPVMASGTLGSSGRILITPSVATGEIPARFYLGVTAEDIADGADGKVVEFGKIRQFDTSAFIDGDVLWLDPANNGRFTKTEPTAPNLKIATALVIDADAKGTIMVRANQGHKLADAHDVEIVSPADNDVLKYDASTGVWRNEPLT